MIVQRPKSWPVRMRGNLARFRSTPTTNCINIISLKQGKMIKYVGTGQHEGYGVPLSWRGLPVRPSFIGALHPQRTSQIHFLDFGKETKQRKSSTRNHNAFGWNRIQNLVDRCNSKDCRHPTRRFQLRIHRSCHLSKHFSGV